MNKKLSITIGTLEIENSCHTYAAKCKHCGYEDRFYFSDAKHVSQVEFIAQIMNTKFPCFSEHCYSCENISIFELTAMSSQDQVEL